MLEARPWLCIPGSSLAVQDPSALWLCRMNPRAQGGFLPLPVPSVPFPAVLWAVPPSSLCSGLHSWWHCPSAAAGTWLLWLADVPGRWEVQGWAAAESGPPIQGRAGSAMSCPTLAKDSLW